MLRIPHHGRVPEGPCDVARNEAEILKDILFTDQHDRHHAPGQRVIVVPKKGSETGMPAS